MIASCELVDMTKSGGTDGSAIRLENKHEYSVHTDMHTDKYTVKYTDKHAELVRRLFEVRTYGTQSSRPSSIWHTAIKALMTKSSRTLLVFETNLVVAYTCIQKDRITTRTRSKPAFFQEQSMPAAYTDI
jgi:hypothetical protein